MPRSPGQRLVHPARPASRARQGRRDLDDLYRRGAIYVDKILRGAKPADLPVEQAEKLELIVNLRTAKALRLAIPQSLLRRTDAVID